MTPLIPTWYKAAMPRELVQFEEQGVIGWGCSACAWIFLPSGPPEGTSMEEMKRNFQLKRDKEFASHICAKHPKL